jgi:hypothetical protein
LVGWRRGAADIKTQGGLAGNEGWLMLHSRTAGGIIMEIINVHSQIQDPYSVPSRIAVRDNHFCQG